MLVGLTGTFGSGKSTVAGMFEQLGAFSIDADALAREVVEKGTAGLEAVRRAFGDAYITAAGDLDRRAMAQKVFQDEAARARLNAIIHPRVARRMEEVIKKYRKNTGNRPGKSVIVLNVPLLFEANLTDMVEKVVVVCVKEAARFHRVRKRDGLPESEVIRRLAAQWPQRQKAAHADFIIDNSYSKEATWRQVRQIYKEIKEQESGREIPEKTGR